MPTSSFDKRFVIPSDEVADRPIQAEDIDISLWDSVQRPQGKDGAIILDRNNPEHRAWFEEESDE